MEPRPRAHCETVVPASLSGWAAVRWCGVGSLLSGEDEPRVRWATGVHKGVLSAEEAPLVESTVVLWVQELRYVAGGWQTAVLELVSQVSCLQLFFLFHLGCELMLELIV